MKPSMTVIKGDITVVKVDAIVNAANRHLLGGGGVDGAIHRAGGPEILEECRKIGGCSPGEAVVTTAGKLPATYVIHTVGPIWHGGNRNERETLRLAYLHSLQLADKLSVKTIAFPNISTGVYQFPKPLAADLALETVNTYIHSSTSIEQVMFVCFDEENYQLYVERLKANH